MDRSSALIYRSFEPEIREGLRQKAKYVSNLGYIPSVKDLRTVNLEQKPIYEEVNKIPVKEQVSI